MIINFSSELQKLISHSEALFHKYKIKLSSSILIPEEHEEVFIIFKEDMEKISAIVEKADELDKRNKELETMIKNSGLEEHNKFYYPLGGGSLF